MPIYVPGKVTLRKEFVWNETVWNPSMIQTALWLDAADASTITENGGAVSQWSDKSGNNRNAVNVNSSPSTGTKTLNGVNVLDFAGMSDDSYMSVNFSSNQPIMYLAVAGLDSYTGTALADGESGGRNALVVNPSSQLVLFADGTAITSSPLDFGSGAIISALYQGASSIGKVNGTVVVTGDPGTSSLASPMRIGNDHNGGNKWNGFIAEFITLTSAPSSLVLQKLEGYLAHKWGLTANLPAGHPYKLVGPTP